MQAPDIDASDPDWTDTQLPENDDDLVDQAFGKDCPGHLFVSYIS